MDSLGRRSGRQMARMRRQRSQEWRERDFSSSENDEDPEKAYRYALDERVMQYEKEVKAGLDARGMPKVTPNMPSIPLDRSRPGLPITGVSNIQTVENRTYAPLSGSDGDTETDNPQSPIQMLIHQQSPHLNLPTSLGRMTLPLQRGPSTSSSDNNSDTTFPDTELIVMRANAMGDRNGLGDSPPEPAPPEVPPRGISMHHSDLASVRTPRDVHTLSNASRAIYSMSSSVSPAVNQTQIQEKDSNHDHNLKQSQDSRLIQSTAQPSVQNNSHPSLLPAIMPVHTVRNNTVSLIAGHQSHHHPMNQSQHCNIPPSQVTTSHFAAANFQIRKSCSHRCSWKCLAIFLIFVTVLLTAALAYFGAVSTMPFHLESSPGCILVEDAQLASMEGIEDTPSPTVKVPTMYPTRVAPNDHNLWPVMEVSFGHKTSHKILPHGFWNFQIQQTRVSLVRFNLSLAESADGALYGRRHQPPTITRHDFVIKIEKHALRKRQVYSSAPSPLEVSFLHHLDPGWWFFSLYNDGGEPQAVTFIAEIIADGAEPCLHNCHNHGACTQGKCECYRGYTGNACELSLCPVLCSNHGTYSGGVCHCERGWKGSECGIPELDCEVPDCNSHGECRSGFCVCNPGFKGRHCDQVDCLDPVCSEHGICAGGRCICRPGWNGHNCSHVDDRLVQCLPNCSGHGTFDLDIGQCVCEKYWTGSDCSEAFCNADCGAFGKCIGEHCHCVNGWTGTKCDHKLCDSRCSVHGQCNNGTCVCMQGWNGRHCTLEGCPMDCNHHGDCTTLDGEYQCHCHDGWDGLDCAVQLEKACDDGIDNDNDGVVDCADSECCVVDACRDSLMCVTTADPVDVLNRKQPPAVTASFYQRVKFLIEEKSVQSYVHKDEYSENRVSVIRGRVVNKLGQGIIGTRVSVDTEPNFGFALSRDQGWFDIMVNGGGAVTLRFHRNPFLSTKKKIMVPWNQIVVMDTDAIMVTAEDQLPPEPTASKECVQHDHSYMRPTVHETWQPGMLGGCPDRRVIYMETQVVQESLEIPGSNLHLLYQSSSSPGYHGSLYVQLTPERIPPGLSIVHLRVIIEGVLIERRFEADPNVTFTFPWNKRNVYKQKVYGIATAIVSVGYQYASCADIVWVTQTATLQGYDMDISEIGGWNLDIHHRYNFQDGILQKGDGTTVYFARQPSIVQVVMGNGEQRPLMCEDCNGVAKDGKLLAPVALTSGPDGSIYVGDFNLVRRISQKGNVHTILKLSAMQMSHHYHLTVHPVDGSLYMSSPEKGQIVRVSMMEDENGDTVRVENVETVVGNGERCIVGDYHACGDGGLGIEARLAYPKGMTISSDGVLYFADGTNIRMVDKHGIIHTLIGSHHHHRRQRKPLPCNRAILATEVQLLWPSEVTLSPLDGSLYFIDDNMIMKLTKDWQVFVVTGHPLHCEDFSGYKSDEFKTAKGSSFGAILNMAFAPNGNLLFVEVTADKVNYLHVVTPEGKLERFAGTAPKCDCVKSNCTCSNPKYSLAINTRLFAISALTITPDGVVYVADHGSLRILSISRYVPKPNQLGEYEITFPDTQEIYIFNRHGQHTLTKNIQTGKAVYSFLYSVNTSFGKLSTVTDAASNKISFLRDYSGKITTIENAQGQEYTIKISKMGLMEGLRTYSNFAISFEYHGGGGLLSSRMDSAENTYVYRYDDNGRLMEAITPTGKSISLTTGMYPIGAVVTMTQGNGRPSSLIMTSSSVITKQESSTVELQAFPNGTSKLFTPWGYQSEIYSEPHVGLELTNPIQAEMFFTPIGWRATSGHISALVEWKYGILGDIRAPERLIERQLWVNNISVLTIEYDQTMLREVIYDKDHYSVLAIQYNNAGKPIQWVPSIGGLPVNIMYDRFGRLSSWQWGKMGEEYTYDQRGLLTEIKYEDNASLHYGYAENSLPIKFILSSKREFQLHYDNRGGLKHITMPSGNQHHFSVRLSLEFTKLLYTPPGFKSPLVQEYDDNGQLRMEIHPNGIGRILYRHRSDRRLAAILYGGTKILYEYGEGSDLVSEIYQRSGEFEYRKEYKYQGILVTEERHTFGTRTALSNARFVYEYDDNFRLLGFKGRIGGQDIPPVNYTYDSRTGLPKTIGHFKVSGPRPNETSVYDGVAMFNRSRDMHFRDVRIKLTIDKSEVYKMDVGYDKRNRISQIRTQLRKMGLVANSDLKDYSYDVDGQLKEVHAHDTWKFEYDSNGNMISLNFRGHVIPLQYNEMDRIVKYSEMSFKVDARGFITQRGEEHFYFDAKGHMTRATQLNRYDVWYYYDASDRLIARKDHFGNVTQFFYVNPNAEFQVTHVFSPRDGRIMSLLYDDRDFLIYARVGAHRYYVGTDLGGTPVVMFNNYGEVVREMLRSPYGHIVYDSNPFIYMPIDYRGGILDSVTGLIHLRDRVYDPLIGHWMTPKWKDISLLFIPHAFNFFRINGNDPVNPHTDKWFLTDHQSWLRRLGYDASSLVPHLNPKMHHNCLPLEVKPILLIQESLQAVSGVSCIVSIREATLLQLTTVPQMMVKKEPVVHHYVPRLHVASAPLGEGVVVSRSDKKAVVRASVEANGILRDVMTSVLNQSYFLDIHLRHQRHHDIFFFVKENVWQVTPDCNQLQRLGSNMVNFTVHKSDAETGKETAQHVDVKIHTHGAVFNVRYGSTYDQERLRILRQAKKQAVHEAWAMEKRHLLAGHGGSRDWSPAEVEQILLSGSVPGYVGEYIHSPEEYLELADDPLNIVFERAGSNSKQRR